MFLETTTIPKMGHDIPIVVTERRLGDPAILVASNEKAQEDLGWIPKHVEVEDIIESAWRFYQKYPEGFKKERTL